MQKQVQSQAWAQTGCRGTHMSHSRAQILPSSKNAVAIGWSSSGLTNLYGNRVTARNGLNFMPSGAGSPLRGSKANDIFPYSDMMGAVAGLLCLPCFDRGFGSCGTASHHRSSSGTSWTSSTGCPPLGAFSHELFCWSSSLAFGGGSVGGRFSSPPSNLMRRSTLERPEVAIVGGKLRSFELERCSSC